MAVVLILCAGLAACTTFPGTVPAPPDDLHFSWNTETFTTADPEVPVTVVFLDPAPGPAHTAISITRACESGSYPERALLLGTTPWRRSVRGRLPVGVVVAAGETRAAPVAPYWAVVLWEHGQWEMTPQSEIAEISEPAVARTAGQSSTTNHELPPDEIVLAAGGFYPLIIDGKVVAEDFPGTTIRAPRAAIGGTTGATPRLAVITTGPGDGGGLTTEELAHVLRSYDLDWALNLDGGRSAYLRFPDGRKYPRGIRFRRPGPVRLVFLPPPRNEREQGMVE